MPGRVLACTGAALSAVRLLKTQEHRCACATNHPTPHTQSCVQGLEDHPYYLQTFVDAWARLWRTVACLPHFKDDIANRVFVDVMNEPDSMGIKWEPAAGRPGAHQLFLSTADALWGITPGSVLVFFEGV